MMLISCYIFILITIAHSASISRKTTLTRLTTIKAPKSTKSTEPNTSNRRAASTTATTTTTTLELLITTTIFQKLQLGYVRIILQRILLQDGSYGLKMTKI